MSSVLLYRFETLVRGRELEAAAIPEGRFSDAGEVHAFAEQAVAWAVGEGLLRGAEDGTLAPSASLTRAELAALLRRCGAATENGVS